ncbi:MAG TPA: Uma2 family endonuclease [Roseiflexaceae bacterium]|nr:Uma2 family endonuclease [Roseiflexaceae bacterium]
MSIQTLPVTATALLQLPDNGMRRELVRGEVIEQMPPGGQHGAIAVALALMLRLWTKGVGGGYVGVEAGYVLSRGPDTVRGPDISLVRAERLPASGVPEGFWTLAPDLAVEVVSPSETAEEVREKVRDFLAAGTPQVWTIYPRSHEVIVHTPDGLARTYSAGETIEGGNLLPGFTCPVDDLFEP